MDIERSNGELIETALSLWDGNGSRSLDKIVPPKVAELLISARDKNPEIFGMSEHELYKKLKGDGEMPTPTDNRLRIKFWQEFDRVMEEGKGVMRMAAVHGNVCAADLFYGPYLGRPEKAAWLLCPPASYLVKVEEGLNYGLDKLREMLAWDEKDEKGKIDYKLCDLKIKITHMLDQRKHGAALVRHEQKNMNLNVHTSDKEVAGKILEHSMDEIDRNLKQLEREEAKIAHMIAKSNPPIDVDMS